MSKIKNAFNHGKAAVTFLTCGDPTLDVTAEAIRAAAANGADLIELGIPFSDPTAEGPVIQEASLRALKNGVTTDRVFDFVRELRADVTIPMVFVTYANVVYSYGAERFLSACHDIGIDGLILPDLPYEEKDEFLPLCHQYDVDLISTITLSSAGRIPMIAKEAEGFLYVLANGGGTRTVEETYEALSRTMQTIRETTSLPCAIDYDFGAVRHAGRLAGCADGVIVADELVKLLAEQGSSAVGAIGDYVHTLKEEITSEKPYVKIRCLAD